MEIFVPGLQIPPIPGAILWFPLVIPNSFQPTRLQVHKLFNQYTRRLNLHFADPNDPDHAYFISNTRRGTAGH